MGKPKRSTGCTRINCMSRNARGFTLIEVLVAATIIAILSVIGVVSYRSINQRSRDAKRRSDLEQVRSALELYRTDNGFYPDPGSSIFGSLSALDVGDSSGPLVPKYMPSIPKDPQNTTAVTLPYYYSVLGAGPPFYSYCVCGKFETDPTDEGVCGVELPAECNYGLKNP